MTIPALMNLKEVVWLVNFDAPSLVVQVAKGAGREAHGVEQIAHQHAYLAVWRDVAHQPNLLGRAGKLVVGGVTPRSECVNQFETPGLNC